MADVIPLTFLEAGLPMSDMGQCLTDSFTVTAPGSVAPPVICGTNDGQHSKLLQLLLLLQKLLFYRAAVQQR